MPHKIDLGEIAQKNPSIDLHKLAEWKALRRCLVENGLRGRRKQNATSVHQGRARLVDDISHDPRLITLQR